jgi:hypothetical protein
MLTKFAEKKFGVPYFLQVINGWVMEHNGIFLPEYRVNRYQLILLPHVLLRRKIRGIADLLARTCRLSSAKAASPYVTVAEFTFYERSEEQLVNRMRMIAMGQAPFRVALEGIGGQASHTLYINGGLPLPAERLLQLLREGMSSLLRQSREIAFADQLRIPIAVNLTHASMERCRSVLSGKPFRSHFIADAMLLLKQARQDEPWQVVDRFEFLNLPVHVRQAELFS